MNKWIVAFLIGFSSTLASAATETQLGLANESEGGVVISGGNARSQSYSLRQQSLYRWPSDLLRLDGKFLDTSSKGVESAKYWLLGLRYERSLVGDLSAYAGQNVESDVFSGYLQRYNTDVGAKYFIIKEEAFAFFGEAGYRHAVENRLSGQLSQSLIRVYAEGDRDWTKTFSTKADLEYLPNLTISSDYQLNFSISASAAISEIFALKTGLDLKYRKIPIAPATEQTDSQFTTAVVAKF